MFYLKKNSQRPQEKRREIQIHIAFGPIISCFSVERDFNFDVLLIMGLGIRAMAKRGITQFVLI